MCSAHSSRGSRVPCQYQHSFGEDLMACSRHELRAHISRWEAQESFGSWAHTYNSSLWKPRLPGEPLIPFWRQNLSDVRTSRTAPGLTGPSTSHVTTLRTKLSAHMLKPQYITLQSSEGRLGKIYIYNISIHLYPLFSIVHDLFHPFYYRKNILSWAGEQFYFAFISCTKEILLQWLF